MIGIDQFVSFALSVGFWWPLYSIWLLS